MKRTASLALCLLGLCGTLTVHGQNVEYVGSALWDGVHDVKVVDNHAYCAFYNGLVIVDVSNPSAPALVSYLYCQGWASGIDVAGDYAYLADGESGLRIINVSNPQSPVLAGSYDTPSSAWGVFVAGGYAYVADGFSGLQIVNVTNPQSPTLAGSCDTGEAWDVFALDSCAYLADLAGLLIVNVTNPQSPTLAGSYDTPWASEGVFVAGGYAYVADWFSGLQIVNVSNPQNPTLAGSCDTPGYADGVFAADGYAYIADRASLQIVNVTNPQNPFLAGSYDTPGDALDVFVKDDFIYVADGSSLLILHFNPQGADEVLSVQPDAFRLTQNYPNPFNPTTMLSYTLDKTGPAELSIFNSLGQRAAMLFSGVQATGEHHITWDAAGFPSGSYYARLKAADQMQTIRMLLLK